MSVLHAEISGAKLESVWPECVLGGRRIEIERSVEDKECAVWGVGNSDEGLKFALIVV